MICKNCGAQLESSVIRCPACGAPAGPLNGGVGFWDLVGEAPAGPKVPPYPWEDPSGLSDGPGKKENPPAQPAPKIPYLVLTLLLVLSVAVSLALIGMVAGLKQEVRMISTALQIPSAENSASLPDDSTLEKPTQEFPTQEPQAATQDAPEEPAQTVPDQPSANEDVQSPQQEPEDSGHTAIGSKEELSTDPEEGDTDYVFEFSKTPTDVYVSPSFANGEPQFLAIIDRVNPNEETEPKIVWQAKKGEEDSWTDIENIESLKDHFRVDTTEDAVTSWTSELSLMQYSHTIFEYQYRCCIVNDNENACEPVFIIRFQ